MLVLLIVVIILIIIYNRLEYQPASLPITVFGGSASGQVLTPNLPINNVDFWGSDSSIILILRGGIPRPIGDLPESLSQAMLVGCNVSRGIWRKGARQRLSSWIFLTGKLSTMCVYTYIYIYIYTYVYVVSIAYIVYIYIYICFIYIHMYIYIYIYNLVQCFNARVWSHGTMACLDLKMSSSKLQKPESLDPFSRLMLMNS